MTDKVENNASYSSISPKSSFNTEIPNSLYIQKEAKQIYIHRDSLQLLIQNYLSNYVELGTTASLFTSAAAMIISAISSYNNEMQGKEILILLAYGIFAALFSLWTFQAGIKHWKHHGKSIHTLMSDIDQACRKTNSTHNTQQ